MTERNQPPPDDEPSPENVRESLHARQSQLFSMRQALQERRQQLLGELMETERELESLNRRITSIRNVLTYEFPATRISPGMWRSMTLPEAACALLDEEGMLLTPSQIREGLQDHGVTADDTGMLQGELFRAAIEGAPLILVGDRLWGRAEWAEQARISKPETPRPDLP